MTVRAGDERAHEPGAAGGWWETWHLDAATDDGIGLFVRLACAPALGIAWWWTYLVLPDLPGPVVVRDHEVLPPRQGLEIRADGLWGELTCETPFEHWTYGVEAFGVALDEPADALRGEIGERMAVGLDIEWEVSSDSGDPRECPVGWPVAGYSQTGTVRGEVLLGRSRIELDAIGQRSHTWGVPRREVPAAAVWLHRADLDVSFSALADGRVRGFVAAGDAPARSISAVRGEVQRDRLGLPFAARYVVDNDLEVDVEVLGLAPIPIAGPNGAITVSSRALTRYDVGADASGERRIAIGWASWLDRG